MGIAHRRTPAGALCGGQCPYKLLRLGHWALAMLAMPGAIRFRFRRTARRALLIVGVALAGLAACSGESGGFRATEIPAGADWGGDFELTAHTGQRVRAADFNGRVVLMFFGYSHCPDICSPTLAKLAALNRALGPDGARVQVLFISVDPKHDSPAQLAGFVPRFDPSFIGLTGTAEEVAAVARAYRVGYQESREPDAAGQLIHSGGVLVRDVRGRLRLYLKGDMAVEDMRHDIRKLLKERG